MGCALLYSYMSTPTSPLTAVHTISLGWTPVAPLSEEESPALPGWKHGQHSHRVHSGDQAAEQEEVQ